MVAYLNCDWGGNLVFFCTYTVGIQNVICHPGPLIPGCMAHFLKLRYIYVNLSFILFINTIFQGVCYNNYILSQSLKM